VGALSLEVKRPVREADHSPPSSAEVNNAWSYTSTPQYAVMEWLSVKKKHREKKLKTFEGVANLNGMTYIKNFMNIY
jgi:hypothetical protein